MLRITTSLFSLFSILLFFSCQSEAPVNTDPISESVVSSFNAQLAEEVGADEYGMRQYVVAFLKAGPNRDRSEEEAAALQKAHMENIGRMAEAGKLILAGPFLDDGAIRGIYIFDVKTIAEAEALTKTDPAIEAGSLVMELHPWYGSAGLMKVNELHNQLTKEEI